jgi:hypothetical protein
VIVKTNSRYLIWGDAAAGQYFYSSDPTKLPMDVLIPGGPQYKVAEPVMFTGQANSATNSILITDGCTYPIPKIVHPKPLTCDGYNQAFVFGNTYYGGMQVPVSQPQSYNFTNMVLTDVQTGYGFSAVLSNGTLYTWGTNINGKYFGIG